MPGLFRRLLTSALRRTPVSTIRKRHNPRGWRIEEQRDSVLPPRQPVPMYAARSEAVNVAVPIESGEIEVRAHVTLTAAIK